jgi:hypothetical protein
VPVIAGQSDRKRALSLAFRGLQAQLYLTPSLPDITEAQKSGRTAPDLRISDLTGIWNITDAQLCLACFV